MDSYRVLRVPRVSRLKTAGVDDTVSIPRPLAGEAVFCRTSQGARPRPGSVSPQQVVYNSDAGQTLCLHALQQIAVALSTVFIAKAVQALSRQDAAGTLAYGGLFCLSMLLPYPPGALARIYRGRWKRQALQCFREAMAARHFGHLQRYTDPKKRAESLSYFSAQGQQILDEHVDILGNVFDCGTNVIFSGLALGYTVSWMLPAAFAVDLAISASVLHWMARRQEIAASAENGAQLGLTSQSTRFDQHVLTGNRTFYVRWMQSLGQLHGRWAQYADDSLKLTIGASLGAMYLGAVPVLGTIAYSAIHSARDLPALAGLLAVLPRVFAMLNMTEAVVSAAGGFRPSRARLLAMVGHAQSPESIDLSGRMRPEAIEVQAAGAEGRPEDRQLDQLYASPQVVAARPALWTLRGPNASGKSLLLAAIKEYYGDEAVILFSHANYLTEAEQAAAAKAEPAATELYKLSTSPIAGREGLNDGDRILRLLTEVLRDPHYRVICLDECDSHLQGEKLDTARRLMAEAVANGRSVVEIRHRAD